MESSKTNKNKSIKFWRTFSFKILLVSLFVILLIFLSNSILYSFVRNFVDTEIQSNARFIVNQVSMNVQTELEKLSYYTFSLFNIENYLVNAIDTLQLTKTEDKYEHISNQRTAQRLLGDYLSIVNGANWVVVMDLSNRLFIKSAANTDTQLPLELIKKDLLSSAEFHGLTLFSEGYDKKSINLFRVLYDFDSTQVRGYAMLNISKEYFLPFFANLSENLRYDGEMVLLLDPSNTSIKATSNILPSEDFQEIPFLQTDSLEPLTVTLSNTIYNINCNAIHEDTLKIAYVVNMTKKQQYFKVVAQFILISASVVLTCMLLVFFWIFKLLATRIKKLLNGIQETSLGNFKNNIELHTGDEFEVIASQINSMSQNIDSLMKKIIREENAKQKAQYQALKFRYDALQAQVNPHFLFNALESINGVAKMGDVHTVTALINRLSKIFRGSFERRSQFCFLEEEIQHIETYLSLYQLMYTDSLHVEYHIAPGLNRLQVPTFILQPLIENAILHGISKKLTEGTIIITAEQADDVLILYVYDDGVGIDSDKLNSINELLEVVPQNLYDRTDNCAQHIGLSNVHERIVLLYGKKYGIQIDTEECKFTEVKIILPLQYIEAGEVSNV